VILKEERPQMADQPCVIGKQITIRGNLTGDESLILEGRIEGSVTLAKDMTVAPGGEAEADIEVEDLTVNGLVTGEIRATRRVVVSSDGRVAGNIRAPRVVIENGARFKGRIEMDVPLPDGIGD
jgi:cytoskeletal protein CcmA (bactofilin family)